MIEFLVRHQWYLRPWYYVLSFTFFFSYSAWLVIPPHFCDCSKPIPGFPSKYVVVFLLSMFSELRWEEIVRFVDIGGIIDHHCLNFLCFVDIGGIIDYHCLNFLCFVDIGGIIDYHCLNFLLFCWYWWNYWPSLFKLSLFCWYWWNYWPSLFKLSLFCWYLWNYWPSLFKLSFHNHNYQVLSAVICHCNYD